MIERNYDNDWELYSIFIPTSNELQGIIDKLDELDEEENEKEIVDFRTFMHTIWFKYFVINNKKENKLFTFWTRYSTT